MKNMWSDTDARDMVKHYAEQGVDEELALRVYTTRLLGRNPELVLHGGGNTSVKVQMQDLLGNQVNILCVKGSGWDMADIEPPGLPAVRLDPLLELCKIESLTDDEMVNFQRTNLLDSNSPNPSVETLLHAFLPHKFVDHTHAVSVLSLTNQPNGEELCKEVLGDRVGIVPYVMPGFPLSKIAEKTFNENSDVEGLILIKHGIFTFGETAIEAYDKMNVEIVQVYGLTETCGPACLINPEDAIRKAGSTGKAFFHTEVDVVNSDGKSVAPDEVGEVIIRGAHNMIEYWNRPEATEEAIRDGWLYSGDLASRDKDGFIYIQDRIKDMIISGGENIYPAEIENVILSHPGVKEVAVIGQESAKWGEIPLAIVVKSDNGLERDDIIEHCMGRMAKFKMPKQVQFIDEIPRNPTGKILKRILREQFPDPAPE